MILLQKLPSLQWIVYNDERGMRKYDDHRLISRAALVERGRAIDNADLDRAIDFFFRDSPPMRLDRDASMSYPEWLNSIPED